MKILTNPQSGTQGTAVSLRTRHGQVTRQYVKPKNPRTPAQMRIRSNLARIAALWRTLTDAQRAAWTRAGREQSTRHILGKSSYLTGCQFFIKINAARANAGLDLLLDPPAPPDFGKNPVGNLVITNDGGDITIKLKVSGKPAATILVLAVGPCSAGISYAWNFVSIGLLPAPSGGYSDITEPYVARFGVPRAGTRIFIRTRQHINGWEDAPVQVTAVVPKA